LAVQRIVSREKLVDRVRIRGAQLQSEIRDALAGFDEVGDVRGRGFFIGIELVRDRASKAPFSSHRGLSFEVGARCFDDGLILYPCSGNVNGVDGDTLIIAPPYNAKESELDELVTKLARAVRAALNDLRN
jgi:adenosylmethionine-8-amino-7-oxononanoate aminotransferase